MGTGISNGGGDGVAMTEELHEPCNDVARGASDADHLRHPERDVLPHRPFHRDERVDEHAGDAMADERHEVAVSNVLVDSPHRCDFSIAAATAPNPQRPGHGSTHPLVV